MKKLKVVVLMGGKSSEHEISILSGQQVVSQINKKKYDVLPVVISKKGQWQLTSVSDVMALNNPIINKGTAEEIVLVDKKEIEVQSISKKDVDLFFIAMHGPNGEDGTIQGMLELTGIPYTGSGVLASALGMDKEMFKKMMVANNIRVPNDSAKFPCFVKPCDQGSSVGASIAKNNKELKASIDLARKFAGNVLVEEYIRGKEVTCAILGNDNPVALPVIEIVPLKGTFFDYESKYTESGSKEIVPARISSAMTKKIQKIAIKVFKVLKCKGFGRVDFILKDNQEPVVLEINTIPGLTPMSLLPKAAKAAGIEYSDLIDKIINYAIEKN